MSASISDTTVQPGSLGYKTRIDPERQEHLDSLPSLKPKLEALRNDLSSRDGQALSILQSSTEYGLVESELLKEHLSTYEKVQTTGEKVGWLKQVIVTISKAADELRELDAIPNSSGLFRNTLDYYLDAYTVARRELGSFYGEEQAYKAAEEEVNERFLSLKLSGESTARQTSTMEDEMIAKLNALKAFSPTSWACLTEPGLYSKVNAEVKKTILEYDQSTKNNTGAEEAGKAMMARMLASLITLTAGGAPKEVLDFCWDLTKVAREYSLQRATAA